MGGGEGDKKGRIGRNRRARSRSQWETFPRPNVARVWLLLILGIPICLRVGPIGQYRLRRKCDSAYGLIFLNGNIQHYFAIYNHS